MTFSVDQGKVPDTTGRLMKLACSGVATIRWTALR
jgi:hypothetical protein